MQMFVYSIIRYLVSSSINPSFFLLSFHCFFLLQNACDESSQCQNNATCLAGFTLKGYRCMCPPGFEGELCERGKSLSQYLKWRIWDFFWFPMLVWQLFFSCWKRREFVLLYIVLNLSKRKFLTIFYWACVLFSSLARLYMFVLFCFGLSACLLFIIKWYLFT